MTSSSELHCPPPPSTGSLSGGNDSESESAHGTPKIEPGEGAGGLSPEPALIVLPEDQRAQTGSRRRVFQSRRRSRACDACRLRKTKCDTPVLNGPCTSCMAASLVCRFSETGDERRRAGPARRLRNLESTVRDLTAKLEQANALLSGFGCPPVTQAESSRSLSISSPVSSTTAEMHPHYPSAESIHPPLALPASASGSHFSYTQPSSSPQQTRHRIPTFSNIPSFGISQFQGEGALSPPEASRGGTNNQGDGGPATWDGNFYGSSSTPFFMSSYRDYLERLGYALPPIRTTSPSARPFQGQQASTKTPDNQLQRPEKIRIDLGHLLPPKENADEIKKIYWRSRQVYQPTFYWPLMESKWKRAWAEPIWDDDEDAVKSIFCVVMMVLAVGSQLDRATHDSDERQGWRYFEYVRRFHNLFPAVYSMDDAIIFLLMASYLMNCSLPSPTWMLTGATCRVFQELGLHKVPPDNQTSKVTQEIRNRLFWTAYLLDRQISIVFGRPPIIQEADISVKLPGEIDSSGADASGSDNESTCMFDEYEPDRMINSPEVALKTYRSLITTCRYFERVRVFQIKEGGSDNDMMRIRELDGELERVWESFPRELTVLELSAGLEPCALRLLFDLQHARLLLYRSFADFSQHIRTACRSLCLSQSITVCKTSARLLLRCSQVRDWELNLARRTNETVRVHIFRAAAILLLGHHLKDPGIDRVQKEEVNMVLRSLKAVAQSKSMRKPYQMIVMAVRMFDFSPDFDIEFPSTSERVIVGTTSEIRNAIEDVGEVRMEPMDWRSTRPRQISGIETHQSPTLIPGNQRTQRHPSRTLFGANRAAYQKVEQARWHGVGEPSQHFTATDHPSQSAHSHNLSSSGSILGQPSIMPQHANVPAYSPLSHDPRHPSYPFSSQPTPSLVIPSLSQTGSDQAVSLQQIDSHINLNSLILSSDSGLDWNAFEGMMNNSSDYNHPGFGDILARGPDLGWSYPLSSTHHLSNNVTGFALGSHSHAAHHQHEQTSAPNFYQQAGQNTARRAPRRAPRQEPRSGSGEGSLHPSVVVRQEPDLNQE